MPDPDSRLWDVENGRECTLNPSPSIQTFHATPGSAPKRNDHEVVEGVESESGSEHRTGLAIFARKPGITAEDVETIRGKGVRFSQVMSSPSSMATSIQTRPLREIGQQLGELVEKDSEVLDEADDLATPLPRRKSFLLSVVHSTARPRLAKPTPHPKARYNNPLAGLSSEPSRVLYGGRPRLSYPLSQMTTLIPVTPSGNLQSGMGSGSDDHLEGVVNSSFVSTASSHDLTVHHRANASFDPLTGPQGVGRFNAGKLNTYLHGLNRRLQQENELLTNKIRTQQMELENVRSHAGRAELSGVAEDDAEQWIAEKEGLEQRVAELEHRLEVRDKELADEQALRLRDKERWKERMTEVEDGVGQIIADLEDRVQEAEAKATSLDDTERQLQIVRSELESANSTLRSLRQRVEQAERTASHMGAAESVSSTNGSRASAGADIEAQRRHLQEKDDVVASLQASLSDKDKEISSLRNIIRDLESSLRIARESIEASHQDGKDLRSNQKEMKEELRLAQVMVDSLKSELTLASNERRDLEEHLNKARERLAEKQDELDVANERITLSSDELEKLRTNVGHLENALEQSDKKIRASNDEIVDLRSKLSMVVPRHETTKNHGHTQSNFADDSVDVTGLKAELSAAMKEIGRLTSLLDQNPARKALDKARESRISLLEKENQELLEQLRAVRDPSYSATPNRNPSMNGLSPIHRRLINLALRTPKTPGEPLKNVT